MRRIRTGWVVLGAAGLVLATVAAVRSGAPSRHDAPGPGGPQTQQAYALARQEFGRLSGGDWGGAWDLWTAEGQRAVPRGEFVRVNAACRPALGVPYVIDGGTAAGAEEVRVAWHRGADSGTDSVAWQAGRWRFAPDPAVLADYRAGEAGALARLRAAGSCA